jgi:hypothetical protein
MASIIQGMSKKLAATERERDELRAKLDTMRPRDNCEHCRVLQAEVAGLKAVLEEANAIKHELASMHASEVAENERLKEEMAEWKSAHPAVIVLRKLVESHMDTALGGWECVAEIERLEKHNLELRGVGVDLEVALNKAHAEVERLRAALEKIANTEGNVHPSWHVHTAREALADDLRRGEE